MLSRHAVQTKLAGNMQPTGPVFAAERANRTPSASSDSWHMVSLGMPKPPQRSPRNQSVRTPNTVRKLHLVQIPTMINHKSWKNT